MVGARRDSLVPIISKKESQIDRREYGFLYIGRKVYRQKFPGMRDAFLGRGKEIVRNPMPEGPGLAVQL
jgi:hypothetical protein